MKLYTRNTVTTLTPHIFCYMNHPTCLYHPIFRLEYIENILS
jgi:hypothetical protein